MLAPPVEIYIPILLLKEIVNWNSASRKFLSEKVAQRKIHWYG